MPSSDQRLNIQERAHPSVVWFRRDLRLDDNCCLFEASKRSKGRVIPVYILDTREYEPNLLGWPRCGAYRAQFLIDALNDLRLKLKRLGSDLIVRIGPPEEILPTLAETQGATHLYTLEPQDAREAKVVRAVKDGCYCEGIEFVEIEGATLYDYSRIPFEPEELPKDFVEFRRKLEKDASPKPPELSINKLLPLPLGLRPGSIPKLESMNLTAFTPDPRSTISFVGGEAHGLRRVKDYFWDRKLLPYSYQARHGLAGEEISTKLSPWINLGCLSPRRLWYEALAYERKHGGSDGVYRLIYHLTLRDFMIFHARAMGDKLYDLEGLRGIPKVWEDDPDRFGYWWPGYSGFPLVDAFMRELNSTGYISQKGRQIVADFFVNHLKLPWTWAASCFETLLIDYHPAVTWGAFQSVAGVGVTIPGSPTHPIDSGYAVDWEGAYVRYWLPELAHLPTEVIYQPHLLNEEYQAYYGLALGQQYPYPLVTPTAPSERSPSPRERHHESIIGHLKRLGKM
jgi:deoxyribodipyrimidine photo-lyase